MGRLAKRLALNYDDDGKVDMTPMLDIVFIMLIFFIVTSSFMKESGLDLSSAQSSSEPGTGQPLLITINAMGDIELDGRILDISQVSPSVDAWRVNKTEPSVIIATAEDAATHQLIAVTDQVRMANVTQISVSRLPTN